MNASTLEEKVLEIVQDASYEGFVLPFLNMGIRWIAGKINLASLDSSDTLSCLDNSSFIPLPTNYMKGLYWVSKNGVRIGTPSFYYAFGRFQRYHPDLSTTGAITDVAVKGTDLYYANRETADLFIRFFETPTLLVNAKSVPSLLPEYLQEPLLVNFAAWKIYDQIEDGIEDPKTNTGVYQNLFFSYLADLEMYSVDTDTPVYVQDESDRI